MAAPLRDDQMDLLEKILSQPTAPFREGHVLNTVEAVLTQAGVPLFRDPAGNIVVGASNRAEYRRLTHEKTTEPLRIFIAHTDHPGFHGERWESDGALAVRWHGGTPTQHLEGAKVWLADRAGWLGEGRIRAAKLAAHGRAIESAVVEVAATETRARASKPAEIFGAFGFRAPVWRDGDLVRTKAADDLVGTFAIVSLALELFARRRAKKAPPFLGLLTRGEEVGFVGAIAHLELNWLKGARRPLLAVSLETSRALPGAEIGKGPVVRLGDRYTVFDTGALRVFSDLAQATLPDRHQRRVMDGGSCEATAATAYGIPSIGISIPLGNYHNQSFEGGPDSAGALGPAPEHVHSSDVAGMLELCRALLKPKLPWDRPWQAKRADLGKQLAKYRALLRSAP